MEKAPGFGPGDCRFKSCQGHRNNLKLNFIFLIKMAIIDFPKEKTETFLRKLKYKFLFLSILLFLLPNFVAAFNFTLTNSGDIEINLNHSLSVTTTINVNYISGTSTPVILSVTTTLTTASFSFNPSQCTPDCSSILTISFSPTTLPGTYLITVKGEDASGTVATTSFNLTVSNMDFEISATPTLADITPGECATSTIEVNLLSGSATSVILSVSNLPPNSTASFSGGNIGTPSFSKILTVCTSSTTPTGLYQLKIEGENYGYVVAATPTFTIDVTVLSIGIESYGDIIIAPGESGETLIDIVSTGAGIPTTTLTVISSLPAGVSYSWPEGNECLPVCSKKFKVSTTSTLATGTYPIIIKADDGIGHSATTVVNLIIPPLCPYLSCEATNTNYCLCGNKIADPLNPFCCQGSNRVTPTKFECTLFCPSCPDNYCTFPETSSTCPQDCGCNNNGRCEGNRGENISNCENDCKISGCECREPPQHFGGKGFVPCGRRVDDLDTQVCECCVCGFSHFFLMLKRINDFLIKDIVPFLVLLMIIIAGAKYILAGARIENVFPPKSALVSVFFGVGLLFLSWLFINTFLYFIVGKKSAQGIVEIFGSSWNEIKLGGIDKSCQTSYCGDGIVQQPNLKGFEEQCEITEMWNSFIARGGMDFDGNGIIDIYDYYAVLCACNNECKITSYDISSCCGNGRWEAGEECEKSVPGDVYLTLPYAQDFDGDGSITLVDWTIMRSNCENCKYIIPPSDPAFSNYVTQLGKGCYIGGTCQKGKYVLDPDDKNLVCEDVYSEEIGHPLYDYCCESIEKYGNVSWGQQKLATLTPAVIRVKPKAARTGSGSFFCDNICQKKGKICVGVGLTDKVENYCYAVSCHTGDNCVATSNRVKKDCRTTFPYYSDPDRCSNPEVYHVGYTSCLCW